EIRKTTSIAIVIGLVQPNVAPRVMIRFKQTIAITKRTRPNESNFAFVF
ncbi:hypothetical protein NT07LI_4057, partial [Listeria innocua FSL S4-378]